MIFFILWGSRKAQPDGRKQMNGFHPIFQGICQCIFVPILNHVPHLNKWGNADESGNQLVDWAGRAHHLAEAWKIYGFLELVLTQEVILYMDVSGF